jgi:catechol 2,3-dioxygenase-like lactoylglutathione lyase family enzyme
MSEESLVKDLSFRVHHTMLPVADLDRSIAFYTRLLGMKVKERHASEARIDTSDLRKLCTVLEQEGVMFIRPFKQRSDGMGFSAWIRDPDGHELELAERHPRT